MTSRKGLCLFLFCCQPNQISTINKVYFPLSRFELARVCALQVGAEKRKQLTPLCSSQVSGEGWCWLLGNLGSNPDQDPQRHGWRRWAHCCALFHPPLLGCVWAGSSCCGALPAVLGQGGSNLSMASGGVGCLYDRSHLPRCPWAGPLNKIPSRAEVFILFP